MNITKGIQPHAPRILIYAKPGVGKSTLASRFSRPLFFDCEDGLGQIDADKNRVTNINQFYLDLRSLITPVMKKATVNGTPMQVVDHYEKSDIGKEYDTIVIDTLDWLDGQMRAKVLGILGAKGENKAMAMKNTLNKANGGFGNGTGELVNNVDYQLIPMLQLVVDAGYTLVATAHTTSKMVKTIDAEGLEQQVVTPKVNKDTINKLMEWFDIISYLKMQDDGSRTLINTFKSNLIAKNRYGLEDIENVPADVNADELYKIKR